MKHAPQRAYAERQDLQDPLAGLRDSFHLPSLAGAGSSGAAGSAQDAGGTGARPACGTGPGAYLCGHSLGLQPKEAARLVAEELESWARRGVAGHFDSPRPWVSYHERLAPGLAYLAGAMTQEVVAMNTLTVNLHLMLVSFYRPTPQRYGILLERQAFSSDRYAVASHVRQRGYDPAQALIEIGPRAGEATMRTEDICESIEREAPRLATVLLPGVQYLTGERLDIAAIASCARRAGCSVGFDLAHAMGNVPLKLHDWNVDFAVWCGYKYLNGGPGAIGGCFVHERHARRADLPRHAGWWGHDKASRFRMPEEFRPLPGAEGWQLSNPPILSAAPLLASLPLFERAGMEALRQKSIALTGYLQFLLQDRLADAVALLTPEDPQARGCQLSLRLRQPRAVARAIYEALSAQGYVVDWREPDVIRVAPVPLYNRFVEVWDFCAALQRALQ